MTASALHHAGNYEAGHSEKRFHVCINHHIPFVEITLVLLVYSDDESGIVNQYVYRFPLHRKGFEGGTSSLPIADIKRKQIHIGSEFFFQFFLYSIQFLHITAIEYKPVTVHGKFTRAAFPYSRGGSGDEYNLLFHHVIKF